MIKRFFFSTGFQIGFCLVLLAVAVALRIAEPRWIENLQIATFDTYNRLQPRPPHPGVRIVDIDESSLRRYGQWPWPRTRIAELVTALNAMGPAAIAFDIVFAEPDRTSPQVLASRLPDGGADATVRSALMAMPDHDQQLGQAIARAGNVVTGFMLNPVGFGKAPDQHVGWGKPGGKDDPANFVPYLSGSIVNLESIAEAAAGNGNFNILPDFDGIVRRVPLVVGYKTDSVAEPILYPALSLEALRVAMDERSIQIRSQGRGQGDGMVSRLGVSALRVGDLTVPTGKDGLMWVYYSGHRPGRYISAEAVLQGNADPAAFRDQIVLIGTSAPGLKDLRSTPLDLSIAGVEVHAEVIEQVLQGRFLERPFFIEGAELIFLILIGLLMIVTAPFVSALWRALIGGGFIAVGFGASWLAFDSMGLLMDPVYPGIGIVLIYSASSLLGFMRTEYEKGVVRDAFSRYIAPDLVEELAEHPDRLRLGGEVKDLTVMFTDIRGFTTISEQFDPEGLTRFINDFLTPMSALVLDYRGTIDKYMGDAMMAFWNAPLDDPDHARNACQASLRMVDALAPLNERMRQQAEAAGRQHIALNAGIGLNTGPCCVGNMGSEQRFAYSALGDAVNLASRLEGQTKQYGVDILLGEQTQALVAEMALLECDLIRVKGKQEPARIFALLGDENRAGQSDFQTVSETHRRFLTAYRLMQFEDAERLRAAALAASQRAGLKLERLYRLYADRLDEYRTAPPPPDWDGVFVATSK